MTFFRYVWDLKKFVLLLLLLSTTAAFAQEPALARTEKWTVGAFFSPDYAFRTISTDSSGISQTILDGRNEREVAKFGYTTGFRLTRQLGRRLRIESGVLFSNKGEKTKPMENTGFSDSINQAFFPNLDDLADEVTITYYYYYLDIPIKVNYYLPISGNIDFFVSGGLSANLFLQHGTTTRSEKDGEVTRSRTPTTFDIFQPVNVSVNLGFGATYWLNDLVTIRAEPEFRHSLHSIVDSGTIDSYLYSAGINLGIFYHL